MAAVLIFTRSEPQLQTLLPNNDTDRVPDVNVGLIGHMRDCWVQVDQVARPLVCVQVGVDALNERRLAGTRHACEREGREPL